MDKVMRRAAIVSSLLLLVASILVWKAQRATTQTHAQSVPTMTAADPACAPTLPTAAAIEARRPNAAGAEFPKQAAPTADEDDPDGPPTPAEQEQFARRVHEELAKIGVDASADPNFPAMTPGAPEGGVVRDPTPEELEQMKKAFAESEKALRNLERETPHDPAPPAPDNK